MNALVLLSKTIPDSRLKRLFIPVARDPSLFPQTFLPVHLLSLVLKLLLCLRIIAHARSLIKKLGKPAGKPAICSPFFAEQPERFADHTCFLLICVIIF
jgi:hypothetical protein